jgi:hypothetical protein
MRWVPAAVFVAVSGAGLYVVPERWPESHESAWTVGLIVFYFISGAVVGRWWAIPLAFVPVLLAIPAGSKGDADGTPLWWWVLLDTAILFAWVMLVGVLAGCGVRAIRRQLARDRGGGLAS